MSNAAFSQEHDAGDSAQAVDADAQVDEQGQDEEALQVIGAVSHLCWELQALNARAGEAQSFISAAPALVEITTEEGDVIPQAVDLPTLIGSIKHSSDSLHSVLGLVDTINNVGKALNDRSVEAGAEIIHAAVDYINQRKRSHQTLSPGEKRLLGVYAKTYGQVNRPDWFACARNTFEVVGNSGELPGPEVYLTKSAKAMQQSAPKRREYEELVLKISMMRNSSDPQQGAAGDSTLREVSKRDQLIQDLDRMLATAGDVDPRKVDKVCQSAALQVALRKEIVDALLGLYAGIGKIVERLSGLDVKKDEPFVLETFELIGNASEGSNVRIVSNIARTVLDGAPLLLEDNQSENLLFAVKEYARLRESLLKVYDQLQGQAVGSEHRKRQASLNNLERVLGSVFLEDSGKTRELLMALGQHPDPKIQEALTPLLTAKILEGGNLGQKTTTTFLDKPENIQLLGQALSRLLHGDEQAASMIEGALKNGPLRPVWDLGMRVRGFLQEKNTVGLARFFDDLLHRVTGTYSSFTEKAVALHLLMAAAEEDAVRWGLKGRLKNFELVDKLAGALNESLRRENSPHAHFIESLRAKISRRFSSDLSDYWGQRELVQTWRDLLTEHLELVQNPWAYNGLVPNQVFLNGYLLYGPPGAGKSFLVTCMANQLEIPLVTISREEMAEAFKKAEGAKENEIESTLAEFLGGKIKQAEADRRKSGARACMLFIDEMEAEFLKRDPQTSPRSELTRTNIMLRVIESLIKKHSDIIFVGATNHIDLVDSAALRLGRFGVHMGIKMPGRQDVIDILDGTFARLGLNISEDLKGGESYNKLVSACIGRSPLDIELAVNNAASLRRIRTREFALAISYELLTLFVEKVESIKVLRYEEGKHGGSSQSDGCS